LFIFYFPFLLILFLFFPFLFSSYLSSPPPSFLSIRGLPHHGSASASALPCQTPPPAHLIPSSAYLPSPDSPDSAMDGSTAGLKAVERVLMR
jgi:hypothetical protein